MLDGEWTSGTNPGGTTLAIVPGLSSTGFALVPLTVPAGSVNQIAFIGAQQQITWDDLYLFDSTGGTNPIVSSKPRIAVHRPQDLAILPRA